MSPVQTLEPGVERDRFVVIKPGEGSLYRGIADDPDIKPATIGAVWYPEPLWDEEKASKTFIIHFHGGAYVVGDGRDMECGFAAKLLASKTSSKVLTPQYRLSGNPGGRFPAALQDSITAYLYLLNQGISASRIAISGDSAGANLTIALLRYISEVNLHLLPSPAAALLWSPWLDLQAVTDPGYIHRHPKSHTDYLPQNFVSWGVQSLVPKSMNASDPYISPLNHPFASRTAIWIQGGGAEILYDDIVEFSQAMEGIGGNVTELYIEPYANHDIILIGWMSGFEKEVTRCAEKAAVFLRRTGFDVPR